MPAPYRCLAERLREAAVARIVPRPGRRPTFLSRLFLHTSGAPRDSVPDLWQAAIRQRLLSNWLTNVQGIAVTDGRVVVDPPWDGAEVCLRVVIMHDPQTGVMVMRDRDGAAITGGVACLIGALADHPDAIVAYGDALYAGTDGRVTGHWLKAPRPDPLLVAHGLLLHGLVAVAKDAPNSANLLAALRAGATLQAAMVRFAADLCSAQIVSCTIPVVVCAPPVPVPMVSPPLPDVLPVASIMIPTRNGWDLLEPCLASLRATDWPRDRLEIVVIDNGSDDTRTLAELDTLAATGAITRLRDDGDFNFSRLNNAGVRVARGDLLVLLNNDTTARDPGWLRALAAHALQPGIGAVRCKLLYPNGDVQHAGVVLGLRGGAQHVFVGLRADDPGYNHLAAVDRSVSAVTAACLTVTRNAFDAVAGLHEDLAVYYNDIVFCADLHAAGYRNVCVAAPLFVHHESRSRGQDTDRNKRDRHRAERAHAIALHPNLFEQDPFYSPHLSRKVDYALLLD